MLPFSLAAGLSCPTYADLAAALAAEFRPLDEEQVDAELDALAAGVAGLRGADPLTQLDALTGMLACFEAVQAPLDPRALLIDVVLERLTGHPTTLAVIAAEVGRRAGLDVGLVAIGRRHLVAHRMAEDPVAIDPELPAVQVVEDERAAWRCSHQVAYALLREQLDRALRAGDIAGALRAAELRLALPLDDGARERMRAELRALRARLN